MTVHQYRKRPVVIDAIEWVGDKRQGEEIEEWSAGAVKPGPRKTLLVETKEGTMTAKKGDYIIRGLAGEYYPCKPDIFAESYELV